MDIKKFLESEYSYENFKKFIFDKFYGFEENNIDYEEPDTNTEQKHILKYKFMGSCQLDDKKEIGFFEVITTEKTDIENNRVSLGNILKEKASDELLDGAIAVFVNPKNPSVWRLSFVKFSYDENDKKEVSNLKRFTYVLGKNIPIKTAYNQLKNFKYPSLTELEEAFSVDKVTKEFFIKYKDLYFRLVKDITVVNEKNITQQEEKILGDNKQISFYIKKLLGRIVFLYFVQKKGWLNNDRKFLSNIFYSYTKENPNINFYDEILEELFFKALNTKRENNKIKLGNNEYTIPYLNGGLFEEDEYDKTDLTITNENLKEVLELFDSYNFTVIEDTPHDSEIAIDPEMLGRVFEDLLEDRKEKGAFYTPREIVHYMCQQSIINYLLNFYGEDSLEDIKSLVIEEITDSKFIKNNAKDIKKYLENIKVLDPAIGSGAFPMGMLHEIVSILSNLDKTADIGQLKRKVIENSIYGIDIEHSAVEIAKLRFWLSIVVDEDEPTPLPNLSYKIMVGNSLIETINGFDPLEISKSNRGNGERIKRMKSKFHSYFNSSSNEEKNIIKKDIEKDVDDIFIVALRNYQNQLEEIISKNDLLNTNSKLQKEHKEKVINVSLIKKIQKEYEENRFSTELFLYKIYFAEVLENGGFDIVIANPPYIFARDSKDKQLTDKIKENFYKEFQLAKYQINLYILFFEKGFNLLKNNGIISYIIPNNWMTINTNKDFKEFILSLSNLTIINFLSKIFESANVDSSIVIGKKSSKNLIAKLYEFENKITKKLIKKCDNKFLLNQKDSIINLDIFKNEEAFYLIKEIEKKSELLTTISDVKAGLQAYEVGKGIPVQTKEMKNNRIYHSNVQIDNTYIKYLDGKDVQRYKLGWSKEYLKYGKNLAAPRGDFKLFSSPRILVRQIPSNPPYSINACYTEDIILNDRNSMNIIDIKINPKCLLAVLNSSLITFWFILKFGKMQRGIFPQFKINELKEFPISKNWENKEAVFETLVDYIMYINKEDKLKFISDFFERIIDIAVYELYFKEELHLKGFGILQILESELVPFDNSFETIEKVYKKLSDKNHKVAYNVNFIDTLDIVKTIENKD
ncbi:TaqI-like C-terminal specificity domain-containing protein [Aliarcobacter cryaerophilus]|uniref:Eco57I restriction-modification methylase domain-containing protein n=1 Tax=Aliarcobacter cryaerophilus TaxID=28198 RepID=UPI0031749C92